METPRQTTPRQEAGREAESARPHQAVSNFEYSPLTRFHTDPDDSNVALKLRGIPFQAIEEDIVTFFEGYKLVPDSVKIERVDERPTGYCAVLFESEEEAQRALEGR